MKKNGKTIFLIICSILVILIALFIIFSTLYINRLDKVVTDDDKQVEALCQIYEYFLKEYDDCNIVLDESAFRNFKTNEKFNDENIEKLKQYEKTIPDSQKSYTLFVSGSPYVNIINLMLKNNNNSQAYQQQFSLKPGLFKITFKARETMVMVN